VTPGSGRDGAGLRAVGKLGVALATLAATAGCRHATPAVLVAGGDAARGRQAITAYGCGACHVVPGVRAASGMVGPPLTAFAGRAYIAGEAPNTASALVQWIMNPQSIEPGTAMPALGVSEAHARDIAAYLYTLR
jgi:cytochrome c